MEKSVLLIGTADTKSVELAFLRETIATLGASVLLMDVGVLGQGQVQVDIGNAQVAQAAGSSLAAITATEDEHSAMTTMARGASRLACELQASGQVGALLVLGGSMGTDLALDVAAALPLGFPKVVLSTIAFSPLIQPERICPDLIMMLWAGGLYGLNSLCRSALSQAAGAAVGALRAARPLHFERPVAGMTSLGSSCLSYMKRLTPALEARGFEVAVFHTTGMGGRAFESLAARGQFAVAIDLSLQELANDVGGSCVTAGTDRLGGAGRSGTPQIVAPGAADMVDFPAWQAVPQTLAGRPVHVHNRLIATATSDPVLRSRIAQQIADQLSTAKGATCLLLPLRGVQAWDKPGEPLHDPQGLQKMMDELRRAASAVRNPLVSVRELDMHINDDAFSDIVLEIVDAWVATGVIRRPAPDAVS